MYSLLIEYSWQTQLENAPKYPTICVELCALLESAAGTPSPHESTLLYPFRDDITSSHPHHHHITAHITGWSIGDIMLFWQDNCMHTSKWVSSNPSLRECPSALPHSNYFYGLEILTPDIHCDTLPEVPWHILALSSSG